MTTTTTRYPRRTPVQQAAMAEAVGNRLGRLPNGLTGRTLDSLVEKGYAYAGYVNGRLYSTAQARGYTGFPVYFLTTKAYQALGVELMYVACGECGTGKYAADADRSGLYHCTGADCDHEMTAADFVVDEPGDYIELRHWRLVVLHREPEPTGEPGTDAGECDQCGTPILWDRSGRRVHDENGEYWCAFGRRQAGRNPEGRSAVHVLSKEPQAAESDADEVQDPKQPAAVEDEPSPGEPVVYCDPATITEVRRLAAAVEIGGATYHADGTQVFRLFETGDDESGRQLQDDCPCCGVRESGVTVGMVYATISPRPLQRVQWSSGQVTDWEPQYLRAQLQAIPSQPAPWLRATIGEARPAFPSQRS